MRWLVATLFLAGCHSGGRATEAGSDLAKVIGAAMRSDGEVACAEGRVVGDGYVLTLAGMACPAADFWRAVLTTAGASLTDGRWRRTVTEVPVVTFTTFTSKQRLEIAGAAYEVVQEASLGADVRVVNGPGVTGLTFVLGCATAVAGTVGETKFSGCGAR